MNSDKDQSARWNSYKESIGFGVSSLPAVCEHLDLDYMDVLIKFADRFAQKIPDPVPRDEEDLRNAIQCLVDDIHIFEAREADEGEDLDELYASLDAREAKIQSTFEKGLIPPAVLTAEQPRGATASETAGSTPGMQQLKRVRNDSSEERASRSASPMTDPKGKAPAATVATRRAGVGHPTTGILEPVKESVPPRRSARLMSGQAPAGN
jgi:hypothetical protein